MNKNRNFSKPKEQLKKTTKTVLDDLFFYNQQSGLNLNEDSLFKEDSVVQNKDSRYSFRKNPIIFINIDDFFKKKQ